MEKARFGTVCIVCSICLMELGGEYIVDLPLYTFKKISGRTYKLLTVCVYVPVCMHGRKRADQG